MAESTEGLWMSAKERDRLKVLHEVKQRHITQKQAATELGLSVRWVRKLLLRWRARGDSALRHGLRGRLSNRKTPEAVKRRAVEHPFATIKYRIFGHPRFLLRGTGGAQTEISLATMVYNLKQMLNVLDASQLRDALAA